MGEVWKAKDTKLSREVAIKTLQEEFSNDTDRLARFAHYEVVSDPPGLGGGARNR